MAAIITSPIIGPTPNPINYQTVSGTTYVGTTPVNKRVLLLDRRDFSYLRSTVAGSSGIWAIDGLPEELSGVGLVAVSVDDSATYNAEVYDHIQPMSM